MMSWDDDHYAAWADHAEAHGQADTAPGVVHPIREDTAEAIAVRYMPCPKCGATAGKPCENTLFPTSPDPITHTDRTWVVEYAYAVGWDAGRRALVNNYVNYPSSFRKDVDRYRHRVTPPKEAAS